MSIHAEYVETYRAARKRLWGKPERAAPVDNRPEWSTPTITLVVVRRADVQFCRGSLKRLLAEVAGNHGLYVEELLSPTRKQPVVRARWEFCYRAAAETTASIVQIARAIGYDHTSALHGLMRHCALNELAPPRDSYFKVRRRINVRGAA